MRHFLLDRFSRSKVRFKKAFGEAPREPLTGKLKVPLPFADGLEPDMDWK